jgi:hypothetical protein
MAHGFDGLGTDLKDFGSTTIYTGMNAGRVLNPTSVSPDSDFRINYS